MPIRRWHAGKIIILWVWGAVAVGLMLTDFLTAPKMESAPVMHSVELVASVLLPLFLTGITWRWLGGKESG